MLSLSHRCVRARVCVRVISKSVRVLLECGMFFWGRGIAQRQSSPYRGYTAVLLAVFGTCALLIWLWLIWTNDITDTVASRQEVLTQPRVLMVQCSEDYQKYKRFPGIITCIRFILCRVLDRAVFEACEEESPGPRHP